MAGFDGIGNDSLRHFNPSQAENQHAQVFYWQYHGLSLGRMVGQFFTDHVFCHPIAESQSYFASYHGDVWYGDICFRRSHQLSSLIMGGIISWIAALVSYFQPYNVQLLLMTATVIVSYIIPGHMLRIEAKKQKS